jgi:hypothetical protein
MLDLCNITKYYSDRDLENEAKRIPRPNEDIIIPGIIKTDESLDMAQLEVGCKLNIISSLTTQFDDRSRTLYITGGGVSLSGNPRKPTGIALSEYSQIRKDHDWYTIGNKYGIVNMQTNGSINLSTIGFNNRSIICNNLDLLGSYYANGLINCGKLSIKNHSRMYNTFIGTATGIYIESSSKVDNLNISTPTIFKLHSSSIADSNIECIGLISDTSKIINTKISCGIGYLSNVQIAGDISSNKALFDTNIYNLMTTEGAVVGSSAFWANNVFWNQYADGPPEITFDNGNVIHYGAKVSSPRVNVRFNTTISGILEATKAIQINGVTILRSGLLTVGTILPNSIGININSGIMSCQESAGSLLFSNNGGIINFGSGNFYNTKLNCNSGIINIENKLYLNSGTINNSKINGNNLIAVDAVIINNTSNALNNLVFFSGGPNAPSLGFENLEELEALNDLSGPDIEKLLFDKQQEYYGKNNNNDGFVRTNDGNVYKIEKQGSNWAAANTDGDKIRITEQRKSSNAGLIKNLYCLNGINNGTGQVAELITNQSENRGLIYEAIFRSGAFNYGRAMDASFYDNSISFPDSSGTSVKIFDSVPYNGQADILQIFDNAYTEGFGSLVIVKNSGIISTGVGSYWDVITLYDQSKNYSPSIRKSGAFYDTSECHAGLGTGIVPFYSGCDFSFFDKSKLSTGPISNFRLFFYDNSLSDNVTINNSYFEYYDTSYASGTIITNSSGSFNDNSLASGTIDYAEFYDNSQQLLFVSGCIFNDKSINQKNVHSAIFNDDSYSNSGAVLIASGSGIFYDRSYNLGDIKNIAYFIGGQTYNGGISGLPVIRCSALYFHDGASNRRIIENTQIIEFYSKSINEEILDSNYKIKFSDSATNTASIFNTFDELKFELYSVAKSFSGYTYFPGVTTLSDPVGYPKFINNQSIVFSGFSVNQTFIKDIYNLQFIDNSINNVNYVYSGTSFPLVSVRSNGISFEKSSINQSKISCNYLYFNDNSINNSDLELGQAANIVFMSGSANNGDINSNCYILFDTSGVNNGTISGANDDYQFITASANNGVVSGNCLFDSASNNNGKIYCEYTYMNNFSSNSQYMSGVFFGFNKSYNYGTILATGGSVNFTYDLMSNPGSDPIPIPSVNSGYVDTDLCYLSASDNFGEIQAKNISLISGTNFGSMETQHNVDYGYGPITIYGPMMFSGSTNYGSALGLIDLYYSANNGNLQGPAIHLIKSNTYVSINSPYISFTQESSNIGILSSNNFIGFYDNGSDNSGTINGNEVLFSGGANNSGTVNGSLVTIHTSINSGIINASTRIIMSYANNNGTIDGDYVAIGSTNNESGTLISKTSGIFKDSTNLGFVYNKTIMDNSDNYGTISGSVDFYDSTNNSWVYGGDILFSGSQNYAGMSTITTIQGNISFIDYSSNYGYISDSNCIFLTNSNNYGEIIDSQILFKNTTNNGLISGVSNIIFDSGSRNTGTVSLETDFEEEDDSIKVGSVIFKSGCSNDFNATILASTGLSGYLIPILFDSYSSNNGFISGWYIQFNSSINDGGTIIGNTNFTNSDNLYGNLFGGYTHSFNNSFVYNGAIYGTAYFNNSINSGTIYGSGIFTNNSIHSGIIYGGATFDETSINNGEVYPAN